MSTNCRNVFQMTIALCTRKIEERKKNHNEQVLDIWRRKRNHSTTCTHSHSKYDCVGDTFHKSPFRLLLIVSNQPVWILRCARTEPSTKSYILKCYMWICGAATRTRQRRICTKRNHLSLITIFSSTTAHETKPIARRETSYGNWKCNIVRSAWGRQLPPPPPTPSSSLHLSIFHIIMFFSNYVIENA